LRRARCASRRPCSSSTPADAGRLTPPALSPVQALLLFTTTETPPAKPVVVAPVAPSPLASLDLGKDGWRTDGACVTDNLDGRLLRGPSIADGAMSYAMCTDFCFGRGFKVAGVE
jgi:hypothetical protein